MPTQFKNKYEFWADLKTKMPQYADMDNYELADKILAKYPQYKSLIPEEKGIFGRIGSAIGNNITDITDVFDGKINKTPDQSGYIGNVIRSWWERLWRVWQNFSQIWSVKPKGFFDIWWFWSILWNAVQNVWEVAGWVSNDIIGGAFSGEVWTLASDKLKANTYEVGKDIAKTWFWKWVIDTVGTVANKWWDFSQKYPEASATIAGAGNIGSLALDLVWAGRAKSVAWVAKQWVQKTAAGAINKTADAIDNVSDFAKSLKGSGKYTDDVISKISGMDKETINTIRSMPDIFEQAQKGTITRESLVDDFMKSFNRLDDEVSNTGKLYEWVRKNTTPFTKKEIANVARDALKKNDIDVLKGGKLSLARTTLNTKDVWPIKNALAQISEVVNWNKQLTVNEVLNIRRKLDPLIAWNSELTPAWQKVVKDIRWSLRQLAHDKIPELKKLDAQYAPLKSQMKQVKKDFFNADGTLKDNAMSKLANITGKGKEKVLERLSKLDPEFQKKSLALRAFEDLERATGNKVGTYGKTAWPLLGAILWGWPGYLLWETFTNPNLIAKWLKMYGRRLNQMPNPQGVKQWLKLTAQWVPQGTLSRWAKTQLISSQTPSLSNSLRNTASIVAWKPNKSIDDFIDEFVAGAKAGWITMDLKTKKTLTGRGFIVSPYPKRSLVKESFNGNDLKKFLKDNADALLKKHHFIGWWVNDKGVGYIDVSVSTRNKSFAKKIGKKANQEAIFDLKKWKTIGVWGDGSFNGFDPKNDEIIKQVRNANIRQDVEDVALASTLLRPRDSWKNK